MKAFNSKILLFGEYTLLKGSIGLAVPYSHYSGKLELPNNETVLNHDQLESNSVLKKLALEISHLEPFASSNSINQLLEDVLLGLYFDSNIPKNYGVGSSGTLVAAVYNQYFASFENNNDLNSKKLKVLKNELAQMESYFHGKSSGIDPLVSILNAPTLLNAPLNHLHFHFPENISAFLIDTNQQSLTKDFVNIFNNKCIQNPEILKKLIKKNNQCIIAILANDSNAFTLIQDFCQFEQDFLSEMFNFSNSIKEIILRNPEEFCIKLSGSGGGGFMLGFTKKEKYKALEEEFLQFNIPIHPIHFNKEKLVNVS